MVRYIHLYYCLEWGNSFSPFVNSEASLELENHHPNKEGRLRRAD